jgi:integrase/recombinase XerD
LRIVNKPIESITLADVQGYVTALHQNSLAVSSIARASAAIKSLFTFAHHKTGLLKVNLAGVITLLKVRVSAFVILTLD